jgi:methyltransferase-like protein
VALGDPSSYEDLPYPHAAWREMSIRRAEAVATCYGLEVPASPRARVLEIGCASGGHLLPQAHAFPKAEFIGIDLSTAQISAGREWIQTLGLQNIDLRVADLSDIDQSWGEFDYIISHGVHSWISPELQQQLLSVCGTNLSQNGVAALSYNVLPYWHVREIVREAMQFHLSGGPSLNPHQAVAEGRRMLDLLATHSGADPLVTQLIQRETERAKKQAPALFFHDLLEENNNPVYFHELIDDAGSAGLVHVADLESGNVDVDDFPPAMRAMMTKEPPVRREQYFDFLVQRSFRRSLLCREGRSPSTSPVPERMTKLSVTLMHPPDQPLADARPGQPLQFSVRGRAHAIHDGLEKAAMQVLANTRPEPLAVLDLFQRAQQRAGGGGSIDSLCVALSGHLRRGLLDVFVHPPKLVAEISERPTASPYARAQAERGLTKVTTLLHNGVQFDDAFCLVLRCLDGEHDAEALVARLREASGRGLLQASVQLQAMNDAQLGSAVDTALEAMRHQGLLVG